MVAMPRVRYSKWLRSLPKEKGGRPKLKWLLRKAILAPLFPWSLSLRRSGVSVVKGSKSSSLPQAILSEISNELSNPQFLFQTEEEFRTFWDYGRQETTRIHVEEEVAPDVSSAPEVEYWTIRDARSGKLLSAVQVREA